MMGEGRGSAEHDFTVVESAKHTVFLGNDFCHKAGFIIDQQGQTMYMKRELEAAGLPP